MRDHLIKLRSTIREACDRLEWEKFSSEKKRTQRNKIVQHLELASLEAGALLRELQESE